MGQMQRQSLHSVLRALSGYKVRREKGVTIITIKISGLTITIEIPP